MIFSKGNIDLKKLEFNSENAVRTLFVVPTNRKARRLKKEFIASGKSVFYIETLETLFMKLLTEVKAFQPLDEALSSYLLRNAAREIKPKFFTKFKNKDFPKGTLERIASVISEYKRQGITPAKLIEEVKNAGLEQAEQNKAEDIAEIYLRYSETARKLNAYEIGDVYFDLLEFSPQKITEIFERLFPEVDTVYLRYFTELAVSEIILLNKISDKINVAIEFYENERNPVLLEALNKTFENLIKYGFNKISSAENFNNNAAEYLSRNLYRMNSERKKFGELKLFGGKDKFEEIENAAKIIKGLLRDEKTEPHKIAVVFNLISEYSPVVRTVFEEYGIPFNLSDRLTLDKAPSVKALLTLLEVKKNNFYYRTLFSAINNGYSQSIIDNPYNLQRFAQAESIISGENVWRAKLNAKLEAAESESEKREIGQALKDFEKISEILRPFEKKYTPREFFRALKKFISETGITEILLRIAPDKAEANITAVSRLLESFAVVAELMEKEHGRETKHDFNFYFDALSSVAQWARFNVKERSDYGVLVTSAKELRGLKFDYVFFAGLNDGNLPVKYSPEIFFAKNFMAKEEEKSAEQRFVFFNVFNAFEKGIYLSYAFADDKTELTRSVFLDDLCGVIECDEIPEDYFKQRIYSRIEKQILFDATKEQFSETENREIENKIRIYEARKENERSVYNGYLTAEEDEFVAEFLKRYSARNFSVSQFENYALCPFKYFAERILRLEALEEPEKDIEPILLGNFLHETLYEFYTRLNQKNLDIDSPEAEKLLFSIAEDLYSDYGFDDEIYFYEKEKFFGVKEKKEDSILYHFLENERQNKDFTPKYFEVSFGRKLDESSKYDKHLSREAPIEINGVKLAGKIDRIDLSENKFAVIDYKSGNKKVTLNSIYGGMDLQLPVYLQATKELLGEGFIPAMMAIYVLKFNDEYFGINKVKNRRKTLTTEDLENLSDVAAKFISEYHKKITEGEFSPTISENREKEVCGYCVYRSVCRVDERES